VPVSHARIGRRAELRSCPPLIVAMHVVYSLVVCRKSRSVGSKLRREYVLPNGSSILHGYVRELESPVSADSQVLLLGNERLAVPELLFHPADVGLQQGGVVEAIAASILACPLWMQGILAENIILVGGNAMLTNYRARIEKDLRAILPAEYKIVCRTGDESVDARAHAHTHAYASIRAPALHRSEHCARRMCTCVPSLAISTCISHACLFDLLSSPVTTSWHGGSLLASESLNSPSSSSLQYITAGEYAEYGSEALTRKWEGDAHGEEGDEQQRNAHDAEME
jgi:actin-related protein